MIDAMLEEMLEEVPPELHNRFLEIVGLTDKFCYIHLDDEYRDLCRIMVLDLCGPDTPAARGKAEGWACGVVYAICRVNFLDDDSFEPYINPEHLAKAFGVAKSTMQKKWAVLRDGLEIIPFDPRWCTEDTLEDHPLNGIFDEFDGSPESLPEEMIQSLQGMGVLPEFMKMMNKAKDIAEEEFPPQVGDDGTNVLKFPDIKNQKPDNK